MGRGRPIDFKLSLAANLIHRCLVSQLSHELVSLNVNILLSWRCLWRLNVSGEELLSGLGSLLFQALGVVLALVCLEKLVRVCASWDNHGSVGASPEDTLIVHDILREVLLSGIVSIRVLVLVLLGNDAGMSRKALASLILLQHFLNFI